MKQLRSPALIAPPGAIRRVCNTIRRENMERVRAYYALTSRRFDTARADIN